MNNYFLLLFALLLIQCAPLENGGKELTREQIIANYYEAIGGYDKLKSVKTRIIRGKYFEPQYNLSMDMHTIWKRPQSRIASGKGKVMGYFFEGYHEGVMWEYYKGDTIPRIMDGEAFKAGQRGAEFDESFVDFEEKGHKVEYVGIEVLEGEELHRLDVTLADGWRKSYFLDTETFLIKALQKSMPLHAKGDAINWMVFKSEYKRVDGLMFPHVSVKRNLDKGGEMNNVAVINEILLNPNIDTVDFNPHIPAYLD